MNLITASRSFIESDWFTIPPCLTYQANTFDTEPDPLHKEPT